MNPWHSSGTHFLEAHSAGIQHLAVERHGEGPWHQIVEWCIGVFVVYVVDKLDPVVLLDFLHLPFGKGFFRIIRICEIQPQRSSQS